MGFWEVLVFFLAPNPENSASTKPTASAQEELTKTRLRLDQLADHQARYEGAEEVTIQRIFWVGCNYQDLQRYVFWWVLCT